MACSYCHGRDWCPYCNGGQTRPAGSASGSGNCLNVIGWVMVIMSVVWFLTQHHHLPQPLGKLQDLQHWLTTRLPHT